MACGISSKWTSLYLGLRGIRHIQKSRNIGLRGINQRRSSVIWYLCRTGIYLIWTRLAPKYFLTLILYHVLVLFVWLPAVVPISYLILSYLSIWLQLNIRILNKPPNTLNICGIRTLFLPAALRAAQTCRYLVYSEADFEVFRPAGATRCTDGSDIWRGGEDRRSPPQRQISPPSVQRQGCTTPKIKIFTQIWPKSGI